MDDWWTYTLSDFLLFSPRTYYRLLQRHNESVWPVHLLTTGLGIFILYSLRHASARQGRIIAGILFVLWLWVGWAFLWSRYATINWAAAYLMPLFATEALLIGWYGFRKNWTFRLRRDRASTLGGALFLLALVLYPLLAPLSGRPWQQSEIFGVLPDPTAVATLGLLLTVDRPPPWSLLIVPLLWCGFAGATLWAMGSMEAVVPVLAGLLALGGYGARATVARRRAVSPSEQ